MSSLIDTTVTVSNLDNSKNFIQKASAKDPDVHMPDLTLLTHVVFDIVAPHKPIKDSLLWR